MCFVFLLDYSEGQEILKHNDSSDSLVDAVAATGEEKHDRITIQCYFLYIYRST